mgnify:CR=1 FL=1
MLYLWGIGNDFEDFVKWDKPIMDDSVCLIDLSEEKIGTVVRGYRINHPEIIEKCREEDCIYITSKKYKNEIVECIRKYNSKIKIVEKREALWESKKRTIYNSMQNDFKYNICLKRAVIKWIEQALEDECSYWKDTSPQYIAESHEGLRKREFEYSFNWDLNITSDDIIIDVGSGPIPIFGNMINGKEIDYRPLDPMAYQYGKLNEYYNVKLPVKPQFAIMELLTYFVEEKTVDYCIVHNAMDHSIDILRSFIECFRTVKTSGVMLMAHLASEGIHNNYDGLHKWNIDEKNGKLFFYNQENCVNISEMFADVADIKVKRTPIEIEGWGYRDWILCKITKKGDISPIILEKYDDSKYISCMIEILFDKLHEK